MTDDFRVACTVGWAGREGSLVIPGPVDTDMVRDLDVPKTSPDIVASAILEGVEKGEEDIFPDPNERCFRDSGPELL